MKVDRENQFWYKNARLLSVSVDSAIDRIGSREESPPPSKKLGKGWGAEDSIIALRLHLRPMGFLIRYLVLWTKGLLTFLPRSVTQEVNGDYRASVFTQRTVSHWCPLTHHTRTWVTILDPDHAWAKGEISVVPSRIYAAWPVFQECVSEFVYSSSNNVIPNVMATTIKYM